MMAGLVSKLVATHITSRPPMYTAGVTKITFASAVTAKASTMQRIVSFRHMKCFKRVLLPVGSRYALSTSDAHNKEGHWQVPRQSNVEACSEGRAGRSPRAPLRSFLYP